MSNIQKEIADRLQPPYTRASLLRTIELITGTRYDSINNLRKRYPRLPKARALDAIAAEVKALAKDPGAWQKYEAVAVPEHRGSIRKPGHEEAVAKARVMRSSCASLREIAREVGRSVEWVRGNCAETEAEAWTEADEEAHARVMARLEGRSD